MKIKIYGMPFSLWGLLLRVIAGVVGILILTILGFCLLLGEFPEFN